MTPLEALVERLKRHADDQRAWADQFRDMSIPEMAAHNDSFATDLDSAASLLSQPPQPEAQGTATDRDKARAEGIVSALQRLHGCGLSMGNDPDVFLRDAIASALAGERERAAKVAESYDRDDWPAINKGRCIAVAIRAGGQEG